MSDNENMRDAVSQALEDYAEWGYEFEYDPSCGVDTCEGYLFNPEVVQKEIVKAVVNAAWTEFDADDECTWPKDDDKEWWICNDNGGFGYGMFNSDKKAWFGMGKVGDIIKLNVNHYSDPQDLMFKGDE